MNPKNRIAVAGAGHFAALVLVGALLHGFTVAAASHATQRCVTAARSDDPQIRRISRFGERQPVLVGPHTAPDRSSRPRAVTLP